MASLTCKYCGRRRLRVSNVCTYCRYFFSVLMKHPQLRDSIKKINLDQILEDVKVALVELRLDGYVGRWR